MVCYVLSLALYQLEYQAGLAATRGERGTDVAWLRAEPGCAR